MNCCAVCLRSTRDVKTLCKPNCRGNMYIMMCTILPSSLAVLGVAMGGPSPATLSSGFGCDLRGKRFRTSISMQ